MKRWAAMSAVLALAVVSAWAWAETGESVAAAPSSQPTAAQAPAPAKAEPVDPSTVVAELRGKKLTHGDVIAIKHQLGQRIPDQDVIDLWKRSVVLSDEFQKSELSKDPEILKALDLMTMRMQGEMYLYLKRMNVEVTDADIQKAYDEQAKLPTSELREPDIVTVKIVAKKEKADVEALKTSIKDKSEFDKLVTDNAEETQKLLGISSATLEKVATSTLKSCMGVQSYVLGRVPLGEIKGPVKVPSGWMMFVVTERTQGAMKPLDEVKEVVARQIKQVKQREVGNEISAAAEKEAGIVRKTPQESPRRHGMVGPAPQAAEAAPSPKADEPNDAAKAAVKAAMKKAAEKAAADKAAEDAEAKEKK